MQHVLQALLVWRAATSGGIARRRPMWTPRAFAAAMPALVRSAICSRSNSANTANCPYSSRPTAVVVSMPWVMAMKSTLFSRKSCKSCSRWRVERPSRSSFYTIKVSPSERSQSSVSSDCRVTVAPDTP